MLKCMKIKKGLILNKVDANTIILKSEYPERDFIFLNIKSHFQF